MLYDLFDYERKAAVEVARRLLRGKRDWDEQQALSSFALSATTGAGKTVIATAVIEALLHGSADLDVEEDPRATFLWVTDEWTFALLEWFVIAPPPGSSQLMPPG